MRKFLMLSAALAVLTATAPYWVGDITVLGQHTTLPASAPSGSLLYAPDAGVVVFHNGAWNTVGASATSTSYAIDGGLFGSFGTSTTAFLDAGVAISYVQTRANQPVLVTLNLSTYTSTGASQIEARIQYDGVVTGPRSFFFNPANVHLATGFQWVIPGSASTGTKDVAVQWRVTSGSMNLSTNASDYWVLSAVGL